jgi:hypothetical protein
LARCVRVIPILVERAVMPGRQDLPEGLAYPVTGFPARLSRLPMGEAPPEAWQLRVTIRHLMNRTTGRRVFLVSCYHPIGSLLRVGGKVVCHGS